MIRDRRTILSIVLADAFVIVGALFVLQDRYRLSKVRLPELPVPSGAVSPTSSERAGSSHGRPPSDPSVATRDAPPAEAVAVRPAAPTSMAESSPAASRNILFSYRNSKPSRVDIVGSFNGWTPQPMKKGANHTWSYSVSLEPGDYTYNLVVDGKVIRDPNNPRTAPEGRSLLTVKPK